MFRTNVTSSLLNVEPNSMIWYEPILYWFQDDIYISEEGF